MSPQVGLTSSNQPCPAGIELCQVIGDATGRSESEWREEFVAAFPDAGDALPDVLQEREFEIACWSLFDIIDRSKLVHAENKIN